MVFSLVLCVQNLQFNTRLWRRRCKSFSCVQNWKQVTILHCSKCRNVRGQDTGQLCTLTRAATGPPLPDTSDLHPQVPLTLTRDNRNYLSFPSPPQLLTKMCFVKPARRVLCSKLQTFEVHLTFPKYLLEAPILVTGWQRKTRSCLLRTLYGK